MSDNTPPTVNENIGQRQATTGKITDILQSQTRGNIGQSRITPTNNRLQTPIDNIGKSQTTIDNIGKTETAIDNIGKSPTTIDNIGKSETAPTDTLSVLNIISWLAPCLLRLKMVGEHSPLKLPT